MKRITVLLLSLFLLTGCSTQAETAAYQQISQTEAMDLMKTEKDYLILDVRTPEEYNTAHIKNAVNLPVDEINSSNLSLLPQKDQMILVYCRSGNRSKRASQSLADLGYTQILEFGGINTWKGETE